MDTFVPNIEIRKAVITVNMIDNLIKYLKDDNLADKETIKALADARYVAESRLEECR